MANGVDIQSLLQGMTPQQLAELLQHLDNHPVVQILRAMRGTPGAGSQPFEWRPPGIGAPPGDRKPGVYVPELEGEPPRYDPGNPPPGADQFAPVPYPAEDPSSQMFWKHHQGPTISPGPPLPAETGPGDWRPFQAQPLLNVPVPPGQAPAPSLLQQLLRQLAPPGFHQGA